MTKKNRQLIEILLDNVKPEDWPENSPYAAQDKCDAAVYVYSGMPDISSVYNGAWACGSLDCKYITMLDELCKYWSKTIVHRDEFMKRWNERNTKDEQKTPQQLAIEKFGTDWHDNEGVQPVDGGILVDFEIQNKKEFGLKASYYDFGLTQSIPVTKWRIHSDEKESKIGEKEKALEWIGQPMTPCSEEIPCHFVDVKSPLSTQIGGDHYTKLAIQPMQYSMKNKLDPLQHTIIKYVTRFRDKAGIEDLEKAKHCIDMLIEYERDK